MASFSGLVHYVVARRETTGFEVPHTFFQPAQPVQPVAVPPPGRLLAEDELSPLTSRDRFVEFLIAH